MEDRAERLRRAIERAKRWMPSNPASVLVDNLNVPCHEEELAAAEAKLASDPQMFAESGVDAAKRTTAERGRYAVEEGFGECYLQRVE